MELFVVFEVMHQCFKAIPFITAFFEIIKCHQDYLVSAADEANGSKKFKYKRLGPKAAVVQAEGNAVDRLFVGKHKVEPILKQ